MGLSGKFKIFIVCFLLFLTNFRLFRQLSSCICSLWSLLQKWGIKEASLCCYNIRYVHKLHTFLGKEWPQKSTKLPFTDKPPPRRKGPGIQATGGWMGPSSGMHCGWNRKIATYTQNWAIILQVSSPKSNHYTELYRDTYNTAVQLW